MKQAYFYIVALVLWLIFLETVCDLKGEDLYKATISWILVGIFYEICSINKKIK